MSSQSSKSRNSRSRTVKMRLPYQFDDVLKAIAKDADPDGLLEMYDPKTDTVVNESAVIKHALIYRYNEIDRNGYGGSDFVTQHEFRGYAPKGFIPVNHPDEE